MVNKDLTLDENKHFKFSNNSTIFQVASRLAEISWIRIDTVDSNYIYCIFHESKLPYARPLLSSYSDSCVEYSRMTELPFMIIASFEVLPF